MGAGRRFVRAIWLLCFGAPLALSGCRDEPTAGTAPFAVEPSLTAPPTATVGTRLLQTPTFIVRNASGFVLANTPVRVAVTAGKGILLDAPVRTKEGSTPVGTWTLDTLAGLNALTILAGSAPPVLIEIVGVPDAPTAIRVRGGGQSGLAGDQLAEPLGFDVVDRYGNSVSGRDVEVAILDGGGDVAPASVKSSAAGAGVTWRLGRHGGQQRLTVRTGTLSTSVDAAIRSDYLPIVRFHGNTPSAEVQGAFQRAAARVNAMVTGEVSQVPVFNFDMSRCGLQGPTISEVIDDLVIYATVTPMDGAGKVLASAGPCVVRTQSQLPVIGLMRFDSDDIGNLIAIGRLEEVVLHEMLHVLGIGPGWRSRNLVLGSGTSDPRFAGAQAALHCLSASGSMACSDQTVPIENLGGSGTAEVHWREALFDGELMTGFIEPDAAMPLSAMSVASLADLGYTVNLLAADPYVIPDPARISPRLSPSFAQRWESAVPPLFEVTDAGWIRPLKQK